MRNQPPEFASVVLDSLTAHIAVLDQAGVIIGVNAPWRRYATDNAGETRCYYVGSNYLEVCAQSARAGDRSAATLAAGLREVLDGRRDSFEFEYPCHAPGEEHWYIARITRCSQQGASRVVVAHDDISARKRAELALARTEHTLRMILDALPVGVWLSDANGTIVQGNAAGQRIRACGDAPLSQGFSACRAMRLDSGMPIVAEDWASARALRDGIRSIDEPIRLLCRDGKEKIILNSAIPLHDADGSISGAIIVDQDIGARFAIEQELRRASLKLEAANAELQRIAACEHEAARTDELTGLCNRRLFFERAEAMFSAARDRHQPLSVVIVDLDHFKQVNDTYGHPLGDHALRHVAALLRTHLRPDDVLARYGGEEFVLLLPDTDGEAALQRAEQIRGALERQPLRHAHGLLPLSLSAGVAASDAHGESLAALIHGADHALYAAKEGGRNRCHLQRLPQSAAVPTSVRRANQRPTGKPFEHAQR